MNLNDYQKEATSFRDYPPEIEIVYPTLGLGGEIGETQSIIQKKYRSGNVRFVPEEKARLLLELGDILWFLSQVANDVGLSLEEIATSNLEKLADRVAGLPEVEPHQIIDDFVYNYECTFCETEFSVGTNEDVAIDYCPFCKKSSKLYVTDGVKK